MKGVVARMVLGLLFVAISVCAAGAAETPPPASEPSISAAKAEAAAEAAHKRPATPAMEAAEKRYRDYLEREHALGERETEVMRGRIESKYKGYKRPKRKRKQPKK